MPDGVRLEPYASGDADACLAILESNTPRYFGSDDREEYVAFLGRLPGEYYVLRDAAHVVIGCGGIAALRGGVVGVLTWGMVRADLHGRGLGSYLTLTRLRLLVDTPGVEVIVLDTSNETAGFYERLGFRTTAVTRDYFAPGLHRHMMERAADRTLRQMLAARDGAAGGAAPAPAAPSLASGEP